MAQPSHVLCHKSKPLDDFYGEQITCESCLAKDRALWSMCLRLHAQQWRCSGCWQAGPCVAWHMQLPSLWDETTTFCLLLSACRLLMPSIVPGSSP